MANITPFIATNSYIGQKQQVKAKKFVWIKVGEGKVNALDDQQVYIAGKISLLGYSGDLDIHLTLTDDNADATEGSCKVKLNKYLDENAKYKVQNNELVLYAIFGDKEQNIAVSPCDNGTQTQCRLFGHVNETVHLQPSN